MKHLIELTQNEDGSKAVSARDLYSFLEVKTDFTHWCKRMFDYGFEDGLDFTPFLTKSTGGRPSSDYALTIDCAKEISMLQRTDKGKQARQYFIEVEKASKGFLSSYMSDPIMMIRKEQLDANNRISNIESRQSSLEDIVSIEMKIDKEKLRHQQAQLDKLWDIQDRNDLYTKE